MWVIYIKYNFNTYIKNTLRSPQNTSRGVTNYDYCDEWDIFAYSWMKIDLRPSSSQDEIINSCNIITTMTKIIQI